MEVGHTQEAKESSHLLKDSTNGFHHSETSTADQAHLEIATLPGDLILDSFAGSGTTGHAVIQLNREDGGNRRFILVEMDKNICRNVTAERLKRVCSGYTKPNGEQVEGLGGGFRYCQLGEPLFAADGSIKKRS